jgi:hypothetical protein
MNTGHHASLQAKHAMLDNQINAEEHRPAPDPIVIADLKRRKLRVKEELQGI